MEAPGPRNAGFLLPPLYAAGPTLHSPAAPGWMACTGLGVLGAPDLEGRTEDFSLLPVLSPGAAKYF